MSNFIASPKQEVIFDTWQNEDLNILIGAVAGSGKTTTLLQLLNLCQYKTLFLAFNKSVQEEIQYKIDQKGLKQGKALTIHSLGFSAIKNKFNRVNVNKGKNFELVKMVQARNKSLFKKYTWKDRFRISYTLMDMNDISRLFLTEDISIIKQHFKSMDKDMLEVEDLPELWEDFLTVRKDCYTNKVVEIDFIDMIFIPVEQKLHIPINPYYLMVDEAQDLNLCQHTLISNLIEQGDIKKWIAVGDRNQSIYGFSGAYSTSFDMFLDKPGTVELPLDICYRSATSIIDVANEVYDVMQAFKTEEGIVDKIYSAEAIKDESMIICRNSGPLINLYFELLGLGKSCYIKGEDILNSIIRFAKPYNSSIITTAKAEMDIKLSSLEKDKTDNGKYKHFLFKQNLENFKKLVSHLANDSMTVDTFINKVKAIFVDKKNAIMLCTIHKSKGLEADIVYILNENLIPSRFANSTEQLRQEKNLKYVARTRAKKELYFLKQ